MSAGLAEVLAAHRFSGAIDSREGWVECDCEAKIPLPCGFSIDGFALDPEAELAAMDAHVADAVNEWLGERLREADIVEAVCEAIALKTGEFDCGETEAALAAVGKALGVRDV